MIIDMHAHLGKSWLGWSPSFFQTASQLNDYYAEFGVDKACINSFKLSYDPIEGNTEIAAAVKQFPNRFIGFAVISPRWGSRKDVEAEIDRCVQELGFKGIKIHPSLNEYFADSPVVYPVVERAIHYDIPILAHCWSDTYSHPRNFANLSDKYPEAKILMGHMGGDHWLDAIHIAATHKNLYLDTADSHGDLLVIHTAVEVAGEDKVTFGTDVPAFCLPSELAKVKFAMISETAKAKILGGNAARLLKL
ncbi:MAG: amidohydrolase family protein [Chloroflexi bacterium]|nr:amidohydrolase family protein [Chloroflexota bacterium]